MMIIKIQPPYIQAPINFRETLKLNLGLDLPICGGLGYSQQNAIIIDCNDSIVDKQVPFDGVGLEYEIVKYRLEQELINFRPVGSDCYEFKWDLIEQRLISDEDKKYDFLSFNVEASPDMEWEELDKELKSDSGFTAIAPLPNVHDENIEVLQLHFMAEYWFDITSFYGNPN